MFRQSRHKCLSLFLSVRITTNYQNELSELMKVSTTYSILINYVCSSQYQEKAGMEMSLQKHKILVFICWEKVSTTPY